MEEGPGSSTTGARPRPPKPRCLLSLLLREESQSNSPHAAAAAVAVRKAAEEQVGSVLASFLPNPPALVIWREGEEQGEEEEVEEEEEKPVASSNNNKKKKTPLLHLGVASILKAEPELVGFGGIKAHVRIEHFLDSEVVVLVLRGRTAGDAVALRCVLDGLKPFLCHEEEKEGRGGEKKPSLPPQAQDEEEEEDRDRWGTSQEEEEEEDPKQQVDRRRRGSSSGSTISTSSKKIKRHITAGSFYAKPPGALLARLKEWLQRECNGNDASSTSSSSSYCQSFPKQDLAFHHHDALAGWLDHNSSTSSSTSSFPFDVLRPFTTNLRLWSYQDPSSSHGRRFYTVCRMLPDFTHQYLAMRPERRHVYEIIREEYPCRLYFDVEFVPQANPGLDGEKVMDEVKRLVHLTLKECLAFEKNEEEEKKEKEEEDAQQPAFLEMDSSTRNKFSRHVIVHLPQGRLFRSNRHVGRFVQRMMGKVGQPGMNQKSLLWVKKPLDEEEEKEGVGSNEQQQQQEGQQAYVLAVDTSVYTKNRAFRLLYSRKFGKDTAFQLTATTQNSFRPPSSCPLCPSPSPSPPPPTTEQEWLFASLVVPYLPCGHLPSSHLLALPEDDTQPALKEGYLLPPASSSSSSFRTSNRSRLWQGFEAEGNKPTPFPELDAWVKATHMNTGGVQGHVRGWQYSYSSGSAAEEGGGEGEGGSTFLPSSLLTYQVGKNRWCGRIGRAHKSNHTMLVVDLRRGLLFQKCHDPECRAWKGPPCWVPAALVPSLERLQEIELDAALVEACAKEPGKWGGGEGGVRGYWGMSE